MAEKRPNQMFPFLSNYKAELKKGNAELQQSYQSLFNNLYAGWTKCRPIRVKHPVTSILAEVCSIFRKYPLRWEDLVKSEDPLNSEEFPQIPEIKFPSQVDDSGDLAQRPPGQSSSSQVQQPGATESMELNRPGLTSDQIYQVARRFKMTVEQSLIKHISTETENVEIVGDVVALQNGDSDDAGVDGNNVIDLDVEIVGDVVALQHGAGDDVFDAPAHVNGDDGGVIAADDAGVLDGVIAGDMEKLKVDVKSSFDMQHNMMLARFK